MAEIVVWCFMACAGFFTSTFFMPGLRVEVRDALAAAFDATFALTLVLVFLVGLLAFVALGETFFADFALFFADATFFALLAMGEPHIPLL
ncbi:MAG: hypothetical protein WDN72_02285 [Alphaproteobacteria bacterium]